jgi:hypothetical protein
MKRLLVVLVCLGVACASAPGPQPTAAPVIAPPELMPPSALGYDFQWRQRVTAHWPTGTQAFDAVLQKREGQLILVGLSPLGLPGFVFRLSESRELQVENRTGQALPFEPAYVVADVQRVFFPWLDAVAPGFTGDRSGERAGTVVHERFERGQLRERQLTRETAAGREHIVVHYDATEAATDAPARADLKNQLLGYELVIETLEQTRL